MYSLRSTKLYKGLAFRRHTRGRDCEAGSPFPSASALGRISSSELRDGTRPSVLAQSRRILLVVLRRSRSFIIHHSSFIILNWAPPHMQSYSPLIASEMNKSTPWEVLSVREV